MTSDRQKQSKRFAIAVSFPGEHRRFVRNVVCRLAETLGRERIFYDEWYESELLGLDGDLKLRRHYRDGCEFVVPFFSEHYKKPWCQIEWSAIRSMLKNRREEDAVLPVQMDLTPIEGWEEIDFAVRRHVGGRTRTGREIADLILEAYDTRFEQLKCTAEHETPPHYGDLPGTLPPSAVPKWLKTVGTEQAPLFKEAEGVGYPQMRAFEIMVSQWGLSLFDTRPDIAIYRIEPPDIPCPEKSLYEKRPLLQELRTAEQIRDHFVPFPKVTQRVEEWMTCQHDLLFLGLPFCGKTSLLTYLGAQAATHRGEAVFPILLLPRDNLPPEAVEGAVLGLKGRLERIRANADKRQMLLFLDNVHNPVHLSIAARLMTSPRPWRVWGAARSGEFARLLGSGAESPWTEENVIRDACSLVDRGDAEWFVQQILKPCLESNDEAHLASQIVDAMDTVGQVPMRFWIQVWGLIREKQADIDAGYTEIIKNLPRDSDAVVQSLMPRSIAGMEALVITDFLNNPPWDVLESVLANVDDHGHKLASSTIASLRQSSSLVPDSECPFRATMSWLPFVDRGDS